MLLVFALHVGLLMSGVAAFILVDNLLIKLLASLVMGAAGMGLLTSTHTASHKALANSLWANQVLVFFGYAFIHGLSVTYWWHKHLVIHHPSPNVIGVDDDADLAPFFGINEITVENSQGIQKFFFSRIQGVVILFALAANALNTVRLGWTHLFAVLVDAERRRGVHWIDLGLLSLHWLVWFLLPMLLFDPLSVIGFYILRMVLMGYAGFIAFAPAHFPAEATFADKNQQSKCDFMLRQTATTVNFRTGFVGRLFCAGVEYQIEHHLFPNIPHSYYSAMSPIVKQFCEEKGYPYRTLGWGESLIKSLHIFFRPKPVIKNLTTLYQANSSITSDA